MKRIYTSQYRNPLLSALASLVLGLGVSWWVWGGIYFVVPTLFFLANVGRVWATRTSFQFGDDAFYVITRLYTRRIAYTQFVPFLNQAKTRRDGLRVYYQDHRGRKRSFFLGEVGLQVRGFKSWRILHDRLRHLCGATPFQDRRKKAEAQSPEITPKTMASLARAFPNEVLENPVLPLFALEDPALYREILTEANRGQITERFQRATESQRLLLLCESVQQLAARGVALRPEYLALSETLEKFARGSISQAEAEAEQNKNRQSTYNQGAAYALSRALELFYDHPERALSRLLDTCQKQDPHLYRDLIETLIHRRIDPPL